MPLDLAWEMWQDKERIPRWMPWIESVKVDEEDPAVSEWTLAQEFMGQKFRFSWRARDKKPLARQKIHWRSESGIPNEGSVRFFPRDKGNGCLVQLTISYEVPSVISSASEAVRPFVESGALAGSSSPSSSPFPFPCCS